MKLVLILLFLVIISVLASSTSIAFALGSHYSLWESYQQKNSWKLGDNIKEGDYYHYRICDGKIPQTVLENHCYDIGLTFASLLESHIGPVWIVQGELTIDGEPQFFILQITKDFKVITDNQFYDISQSLERTIFSLSVYDSKLLKTGNVWNEIDSYFTNDVPFEIKKKSTITTSWGEIETFVLGYEVITSSNYFINQEFPFPIRADVYSPLLIFPEPKQLFYFELVDSVESLEEIQ